MNYAPEHTNHSVLTTFYLENYNRKVATLSCLKAGLFAAFCEFGIGFEARSLHFGERLLRYGERQVKQVLTLTPLKQKEDTQ